MDLRAVANGYSPAGRNRVGRDGISPLPRRLENAQAVRGDDRKRLSRQAASRRLGPVQWPATSRQRDFHVDLRGRGRRRHGCQARFAYRSPDAKARSGTKRQRQLPFDGIQTVGCAVSGGASAPVAIASAFADYDQPGFSVATRLTASRRPAGALTRKKGSRTRRSLFSRSRSPARSHAIDGRPRATARPRPPDRPSAHLGDHFCSSRIGHADSRGLGRHSGDSPSKRTPPQKLALARSLHDWKIGREFAAPPAPHRVYAGSNNFTPDMNFHPAIKPRPIFVLRRGDINQPIRPAGPGAGVRAGPRMPLQTAGSR